MVFQKGHKLSPGRQEGSKNEKTLARLRALETEAEALQNAIALKDKNTEDYRTLVDALEKVLKLIQLLSGGHTENIGITPIYGGTSKISIPRYNSNETDIPDDQTNPRS